jgi:ABC-type branched-subunit amino acid transport system substrate-binding protein
MTVLGQPRWWPAQVLAWGLVLLPAGGLQADDIVIGMSAAFRGPSRALGIEMYRGSMAYFEHVNRAGGIHGRKIVIKAYDDGYNPLPAIDNTVRLVEKDNVFLLYGYVGTPTLTRVLPLLKRYSQRSPYLFFPFTGAEPQRQPPYSDFVFNLRASYHQETAGLVDHFVQLGRKRIAVFYQIDAYGRNGWDGVRKALARHQLKMVGEATYRRGTGYDQSLKPQVDILRKTNPDAVISVGAYAGCAAFIRDARDAGWDVPIANVSFVGSESLLALLEKTGKARGKDYTSRLINSQVVPSYNNTTLPAVREYRELMDKYRPLPPAQLTGKESYQPLQYSFVSFEGFLDAKLLVAILKTLGKDLDRKRLKEAVESLHRLDLGIDVPVSFSKDRHQGLDKVYFMEVRDGLFLPLRDWQRWAK